LASCCNGIGNTARLRQLLDAGADVNAVSGGLCGYSTALQEAAAYGHEKVVQQLLDAGAMKI
jgi:ankyrin repeat protein